MDNTFYAIFGTSSAEGGKTRIKTGSYKKAKLGPNGSVFQISNQDGGIMWNDAAVMGKKVTDKGGFQLLTDETIPGSGNPNLYIGVGGADPNQPGKVIPLQTYKAESSLNSKLFPKLTYFVATGDFQPGQLVDRTEIGKYVKIDFEGSKVPTAYVVLQEDGLWADDNLQSENNDVKIESSD